MQELYKNFKKEVEFIDKFLLLIIISIPFLLAISIFLADFASSIAGIILIYVLFKKKNYFLKKIKTEIIFMVIFYLIILTSLLFTEYFKISFLASFFYFRYLLLSLTIYYLLMKYDFFIKIFSYSLILTMLIVLIDALIQYFIGKNLFGYELLGVKGNIDILALKPVTGFFNEEKKIGSYLVRFLPLTLAVIYWHTKNIKNILSISCLIFTGSIIFLSTERTALFLFFIVVISYLFIAKYKVKFISFTILIFSLLAVTNPQHTIKYTKFTLLQILDIQESKPHKKLDMSSVKFYSSEHENFIFTSIKIFEENFLFGSGVKTFYHECHNLKKNKFKELAPNQRNNELVCSTHPHNTYFQLLSDIGIFGFILGFYVLCHIILIYCKFIIKIYKNDKINISYYFINLGVLINIFPMVPSGNIFNNWISLILFYLLGFWLFIKKDLNNTLKNTPIDNVSY
tara:strand:+ start:1730 stop:3097 length:1368 start_codon:yes stop_codon:yes gene_type:complete